MTVDPTTPIAERAECCPACGGRGGTGEGACWDCRGTGHSHAPDPSCDTATGEESDDVPF